MTWIARLKLLGGVVSVILLVAVLTVVFTQRVSHATSESASIEALSYPVGSTFGGVVTHVYVQQGGHVKKGDRLIDVRPTQTDALLSKNAKTPYSVTTDGVTTLLATADGSVADLNVPAGGFATAGQTIATVDEDDSLYVRAELTLSPQDYARILPGAAATVTLPNQRDLKGHVESLEVRTEAGQAVTTAKIAVKGLVDHGDLGLQSPGTPVQVSIALHDDGVFSGPLDTLRGFARSIGLLP
ncbi:HlyD family efflux transporter periplasmic adaptor subunit [Gryllotalpicola ginsengisoli]|uniref:HlyD family efflux transporter periplasmic adaptor subunit n=1 Tax=Gryllotalpicola ginsengisoli TaxID=444608 RepID=UPI0003B61CEA|nr:HlyD family efflux transporter periplasmic adaptor subunit [Gryllotalpicola ginsengisoli]